MDPFSLFAGGGLSAGGGSGGPSGTTGGTVNNGFDSSGWAVSFGSGAANATGSAGTDLQKYLPWVVVGGVVLVLLWKKKR